MIVPKMRFHEFMGGWKEYTLSSFTERIVRKNKNNETDIPLTISAQDGLIDQRVFFNKVVASKDMSGYYLLKNGEFAYNKSSSVEFDYGSIKRLDKYDQGAISTLYICFALLDNGIVDSDFIAQYFDSNKWNKEAIMICAEGARNHGLLNVSASDFFEIKIFLPQSLEEQKKIADCLFALDTVIAYCQSKVDALEKYKRGVMQQLFSQKVRFKADDGSMYTEWAVMCADDLFESITDKNHPEDEVLTIIQGCGTVPRNKSGRNIQYDDKGLAGYKRVKKDDFIIHLRSFEGGLEIANENGIVSPAYIILRNKCDIVPEFYNEYFHTNRFINQTLAKAVEGIRDGRQISYDAFRKLNFPYPSLEEQQKIADCLSAFNKVIDEAKQKLEAYKRLKKGLLQQMFV